MTEPAIETEFEIAPGILKARAALRADLPALLAKRRNRGKWACYSEDGLIGIGNDSLALTKEVVRRGYSDASFIIERVAPGAGSEEVIEFEDRGP